jgi:hypothetical protein
VIAQLSAHLVAVQVRQLDVEDDCCGLLDQGGGEHGPTALELLGSIPDVFEQLRDVSAEPLIVVDDENRAA